jgi:two-component system sensor histidine kinase AgrC
LLDNAIEAAEKIDVKLEREVLLTLGEEGKKKIIEVKNSGEAIELKNIENIFQKGFSTKKGKHRGYGLYNVKRIVNKNNATIELSFRDKYTIFKVLF